MSTPMILQSVLELCAVLGLIFAVLHEDRLVAFEERLAAALRRRRLRVVRGKRASRAPRPAARRPYAG